MIDRVTAVWVPFEISADERYERKCDDLPRFLTQKEVKDYLSLHSVRLAHRKLQWREHFEKEMIDEYILGIGALRILI